MKHYFIVCNKSGHTDPEYFHYFTVVTNSFVIPEQFRNSWQTQPANLKAHTTSEECHEALKKLFTNKHMREHLEYSPWPVLNGWH